MNIEKVKNYNQKLLAVVGTVALIIGLFALIFLAFMLISEFRSSRTYNQEQGVLSEEKIKKLQEKNKRLQVISYDTPRLVDTLNLIYMIPVEQKTLNKAEEINDNLSGLLSADNIDYDRDGYGWKYSKSYYGSYNNLIIFDEKSNKIQPLIEQRLNFNNINTEYFEDDILILFLASKADTNKDGVMNLQDFKSLFLYSLKEKKVRTIEIKNADITNYQFIEGTKNLIITYGIDHNKDGEFSSYKEPSLIKRYDFKKDALEDIVDVATTRKLQMLLEGSTQE
jgi:hypothetical protein